MDNVVEAKDLMIRREEDLSFEYGITVNSLRRRNRSLGLASRCPGAQIKGSFAKECNAIKAKRRLPTNAKRRELSIDGNNTPATMDGSEECNMEDVEDMESLAAVTSPPATTTPLTCTSSSSSPPCSLLLHHDNFSSPGLPTPSGSTPSTTPPSVYLPAVACTTTASAGSSSQNKRKKQACVAEKKKKKKLRDCVEEKMVVVLPREEIYRRLVQRADATDAAKALVQFSSVPCFFGDHYDHGNNDSSSISSTSSSSSSSSSSSDSVGSQEVEWVLQQQRQQVQMYLIHLYHQRQVYLESFSEAALLCSLKQIQANDDSEEIAEE